METNIDSYFDQLCLVHYEQQECHHSGVLGLQINIQVINGPIHQASPTPRE